MIFQINFNLFILIEQAVQGAPYQNELESLKFEHPENPEYCVNSNEPQLNYSWTDQLSKDFRKIIR